MVKVTVYKDEWYPVYSLDTRVDVDRYVEISESLYKKYTTAAKKFLLCQDELSELYKEMHRKGE